MHLVPTPDPDPVDYDTLVTRIYGDDRLTAQSRAVALAIAWTRHRAPDRPTNVDDGEGWTWLWNEVARCVRQRSENPAERLRNLIGTDRPRYKEPDYGFRGPCQGPRVRPYQPRNQYLKQRRATDPERFERDHPTGMCATSGSHKVIEYDRATGWVIKVHWHCPRHLEEHKATEQRLAGRDRARPVPNCGGVLPSHFPDLPWVAIYRWASYASWSPPDQGVCADDWPTPTIGQVVVGRPPKLLLVPPPPVVIP
jgi:hypothetical protein